MNTFEKIIYLIFFVVVAIVLLKFFLALLLITVLLLWFRTWHMKQEPNQQDFLKGRLPNPKPDGFYHGGAGFNSPWQGKKFDAQKSEGINIFRDKKGNQVEKYPFKTYTGKGLFDESMIVLKLDYNVKGNPFWMRWILDEIVEIAPGHYLGKLNLRIIPGFPFSVLFFELNQE